MTKSVIGIGAGLFAVALLFICAALFPRWHFLRYVEAGAAILLCLVAAIGYLFYTLTRSNPLK
jgi:hypothetical protein